MRDHVYDADRWKTGVRAQSMDECKLNIVKDYFHRKFPGQGITERQDFDLGVQTFRIARDTGALLVKVEKNFIDDNDTNQIRNMLDQLDIVDVLKQHPEVGLLVISKGSRLFQRD